MRQTARDGFFEQAIVYSIATASAGENVLTVRVGTPSEGVSFLRAPTRRGVMAEMRQAIEVGQFVQTVATLRADRQRGV